MTLAQVIADSDAWEPDIHQALHSNAVNGKAQGCEVWAFILGDRVTNSQRLAECIYKELVPLTPTADRGIKDGVTAKLAEVKTVKATSVIVEVAFHDNLQDAEWIKNNLFIIAKGIVKGVCNYAGVIFKTPDPDYKVLYEESVKKITQLELKLKIAKTYASSILEV
jgi:N-acetylmuramoyl-L-alanine amidase